MTDLLDLINCIIQEVEKILSKQDKQVLLIIDDVDKLMPDSALKLYYDHGGNLAYSNCNAIMTLPLSVFYSTKIGIIEGTVGNCYTLANIRLMDREGERDQKSNKGYKLMERVIASRANKDLVEEDAIKKAIKYSGGVFRQLLELIHSAVIESTSQTREQITTSDIIFAVADKRNAMKRPLTSEYLDFLLEIQKNKMITIQDEAKRLELLHGLFALQYINPDNALDIFQAQKPFQ